MKSDRLLELAYNVWLYVDQDADLPGLTDEEVGQAMGPIFKVSYRKNVGSAFHGRSKLELARKFFRHARMCYDLDRDTGLPHWQHALSNYLMIWKGRDS